MMPGGRMNPRQMQMMMKRLGMSTEPLEDVEEVIVRTKTEERVFTEPEVTILTVQGVRTYQIVGEEKSRPRSEAGIKEPSGALPPPAPAGPPEEDVKLVMEQANVDRPAALAALKASSGEPAEAILKLLAQRGSAIGG
jgi:nascent polypeptide-associated complex subunit alpha